MTAIIKKNGVKINSIVSDETFAKMYCEKNGYTYEMEPEQPESEPESAFYTANDMIKAMTGGTA